MNELSKAFSARLKDEPTQKNTLLESAKDTLNSINSLLEELEINVKFDFHLVEGKGIDISFSGLNNHALLKDATIKYVDGLGAIFIGDRFTGITTPEGAINNMMVWMSERLQVGLDENSLSSLVKHAPHKKRDLHIIEP